MAGINMEKLMPLYEKIEETCVEVYRDAAPVTAFALMEKLMDIPGMPMHCPPHHYMMPALLLTLMAKEKGAEEDLYMEQLQEAKDRALNVLGGFCGWYGNCGAAVGVGIFMSVYTNCNPHAEAHWADCNRATAKALMDIASVDGPRCCKRNSFFALASALGTIKEVLGVELEKPETITCKYFEKNPDCKKEACPFFRKAAEPIALMVPERRKPENRDGKNCDCMNREFLLKYKTGVMHWVKAEGEAVCEGETICDVEIDKKIFTVPSPVDGVLTKRLIEDEAEFSCKEILGYILPNG